MSCVSVSVSPAQVKLSTENRNAAVRAENVRKCNVCTLTPVLYYPYLILGPPDRVHLNAQSCLYYSINACIMHHIFNAHFISILSKDLATTKMSSGKEISTLTETKFFFSQNITLFPAPSPSEYSKCFMSFLVKI